MDSSKQAQRAVIQFLSAEGVSGTDIYSRRKNVYGTECMSRTAVYVTYCSVCHVLQCMSRTAVHVTYCSVCHVLQCMSHTAVYVRYCSVCQVLQCMSRTAVFRWCSDFRHADKNWITARWACLEESMARSLTVISLLLQSTTHCRYRVYTKFRLTYTAIYRRNRKVLPLGITTLQPQSHFHLGTPYIYIY
jgi:hypothetical protein